MGRAVAPNPPPAAIGDPSGVFVRLPVAPELAASLARLYAIGLEIVQATTTILEHAETVAGEARKLTRRRRRG